jgi:hypothetical protein
MIPKGFFIHSLGVLKPIKLFLKATLKMVLKSRNVII